MMPENLSNLAAMSPPQQSYYESPEDILLRAGGTVLDELPKPEPGTLYCAPNLDTAAPVFWAASWADLEPMRAVGCGNAVALVPVEGRDVFAPLRSAETERLLAAVERFVIVGGDALFTETLARHLGRHRVWRCAWSDGCDGANATMQRHGAAKLRAVIDAAEAMPAMFPVLTPRECAATAPRSYIIKDILCAGDDGALIGHPGAAKSALAPYIGYRVALGLDVFGHRTKRVPVLYIASEDGTGMRQRVHALYERMGDAPDFHLQPAPVDFLDPKSGDTREIESLIAWLRPGLVFIDTLARAFPGLAENESEQMGRVVKVVRGFTSICESAVVLLHHPPKDGTTPRGHSILNGDLDVTLYLQGERDQLRTITMGKNRNGPSDLTYTFAVTSHVLGIDADGDTITAPVVEPAVTDVKASRNAAKEGRLSDKPAVMLRELRNLATTAAELVQPDAEHPSLMAVKRVALRQRLIDRGWFSDDLLCTALQGGMQLVRAAYKTEGNALNTLKRNSFVSFNREWVWCL